MGSTDQANVAPTALDLEAGAVLGFFARSHEPKLMAYLTDLDRHDRWAVDFEASSDPEVDEYHGAVQRVIAQCTPWLHAF